MKVFLIDDEQVSNFIIKHKLVVEGVAGKKEIHTFLSAKEALSSLLKCSKNDLPVVILLDLNMPEMDGWRFLEALEPNWPELKDACRIYILTTSLIMSDAETARKNPMVSGFMSKPIRTEDIRMLGSLGDSNKNMLAQDYPVLLV